MIEAVMLWNEPNNLAHWDFRLDPEWHIFADMIKMAAAAVRAENSTLRIVLGGISPIDPGFLAHLKSLGVLDCVDVIGVHGFPLDWNHWSIHAWPEKLAEVRQVTDCPIWVTEVGVSTFGADELQEMGLEITASLLANRVERVHWYSLFDLPQAWCAVAHHAQPQDSEYSRHFHMGLIRQDGTPKPALRRFATLTPALGICQWFHFQDPRLDAAVSWLQRLGVTCLRTGLSWADSLLPQAEQWYDRQMHRLEAFHTCLTLCFTPESRGMVAHHTSPPQNSFDKHYGEQVALVDMLTERIQSLGGISVAMAHDVVEMTGLERPPRGREQVPVQLSRLLEAHEIIIREVREAARQVAAAGDDGTNDLLVSDVLRTHEMQVWFLAEHLVDTPLVQAE